MNEKKMKEKLKVKLFSGVVERDADDDDDDDIGDDEDDGENLTVYLDEEEDADDAGEKDSDAAERRQSKDDPAPSSSSQTPRRRGRPSIRSKVSSPGPHSSSHAKRAKLAKTHHCPSCRQVFHDPALLKRHALSHFRCSKCELQFASRRLLRVHVEEVHWRLRNLCDRLDLPQSVLDAATELFGRVGAAKQAASSGSRFPFPREVLVAGCVFSAARREGVELSFKAFCPVVKLERKVVYKAFKSIQDVLGVKFGLHMKEEGV